MKLVTVVFLLKDNQILLAMKKRGYGAGKWNGAGGKVEPHDKNVRAAAIRECQEEIGVTPMQPKLVAKIKFYEKTDPAFGHHAHVYIAQKWQGSPTESEEMRPQWFDVKHIPYNNMWADDIIWLPQILKGKLISATVTADGNTLDSHNIKIVKRLVASR